MCRKGVVASPCTFKSLVCLPLLCREAPHLTKRLGCKVSNHGQKADTEVKGRYRDQKTDTEVKRTPKIFGHMACRIFVPQPAKLAAEVWDLNHGTIREVPENLTYL